MLKKLLLLFSLFYITLLSAQEKRKLITGKISDSLGIIKNVNIINQKTKQGTFSSNQGLFRIFVSLGDTLNFSSIQYKSKKIIITKQILKEREIVVLLKSNTYTLNGFDLKKHNLIGILIADSKKIPKRKRDSILKNTMDFSNVNFNHKDLRIDENIKAMPPITISDPNKKFEGLNLKALLSFKKPKPYKAIEKKRLNEKIFPDKIITELGEDYFFKNLKIPKENYHHFLEFCDLHKLEGLHKKGKLLEVIQIFQDQSAIYLKIIREK